MSLCRADSPWRHLRWADPHSQKSFREYISKIVILIYFLFFLPLPWHTVSKVLALYFLSKHTSYLNPKPQTLNPIHVPKTHSYIVSFRYKSEF
jgi:hypothetical protein